DAGERVLDAVADHGGEPARDDRRRELLSHRLVAGPEVYHRNALLRRGDRDASDQEEAGSCSKYLLRPHTSRARSPSNWIPVALSSDQRTVAPISIGSSSVGTAKEIWTR